MKANLLKIQFGLLVMLLLVLTLVTFTSCKDDDSSGSGTPVITGVRVTAPDKADSLFTKSAQGQIIAIIGQNLGNAIYVYINDQKVYFNPTFNTDHSIILTVPSETDGFVLTSTNSSLKDEIRVETSHGTATYAFKILGGSPSISRVQADYPRSAGDTLNVYGTNLIDIDSIYFTSLTVAEIEAAGGVTSGGTQVDVTDYKTVVSTRYLNSATQSYETTSQLAVIIPTLPFETGTLVIVTAAGKAYIAYYTYPGTPTISSISSDMPQIGETVTVTGTEFVQVSSITYGDVTLTSSDFTVASTQDTITFTFSKKPTSGSGTTLTVTTPGGTGSIERFYDYSTLLTTFDNNDAIDNGWGPNASYIDSGTADGVYAHLYGEDQGQTWWGQMIYYRKSWSSAFTLSSNIPGTATAGQVYLAYEVYDNNSDFNNGTWPAYIAYNIQPTGDADNIYTNFSWISQSDGTFEFPDGPVLQDINGNNAKGKWYRGVVPLSKFSCYSGMTYSEIVSTGLNQFRFMLINQSTVTGNYDVRIDNVRVIYIP